MKAPPTQANHENDGGSGNAPRAAEAVHKPPPAPDAAPFVATPPDAPDDSDFVEHQSRSRQKKTAQAAKKKATAPPSVPRADYVAS